MTEVYIKYNLNKPGRWKGGGGGGWSGGPVLLPEQKLFIAESSLI